MTCDIVWRAQVLHLAGMEAPPPRDTVGTPAHAASKPIEKRSNYLDAKQYLFIAIDIG